MARGDTLSEQVKTHAKKKIVEPGRIRRDQLVPSGSTMLDLACSNSMHGAFKLGTMINVIGDKSSGKTLLNLSMLAECARMDRFKNFRLVFDDVEAANAFDMVGMFGKKLADRITPPLKFQKSDTIKDFQTNVIKEVQREKPFIYVLDSFDALTTDEEVDRAYAIANETKEKGSMGMQKAKGGHEFFRVLCGDIFNAGSLLSIISQVKEETDPMSFKKYKRTGGKALDFYAFHHVWLFMTGKIKNGERVTGHNVMCKVEKNKLTGSERDIYYDTYNTYGIDDIASMVDFMVSEKRWSKDTADDEEEDKKKFGRKKKAPSKRAIITVPEFELTGKREQIIQAIDEGSLDRKLKVSVQEAWLEIEDSLKLNRKPRFA